MKNIEVRAARQTDLDALLALYVELSPGNAATERDAASAALLEILGRKGVDLFVAEADGAVVGTVVLVVVPNLTHGAQPWAQIENMVVTEQVRGTGVGRLLLEHALDAAWAAGCYKVQLQRDNARTGAHAFYERNGFTASSMGYRRYR